MCSAFRNLLSFASTLTLAVLGWLPIPAIAERLPIKTDTTVDGLTHNTTNRIVRDSRGFLWFCTADRLSGRARWLILLMWLFGFWSGQAVAERLSISHYGVSEGLANNRVVAIHQDAKGYVWFATYEGLSRFDGYRFLNYGTRDGLGHSIINCITEDGSGHLWLATNGGGVSRLLDEPYDAARLSPRESTTRHPKFVSFQIANTLASNRVNKMMFDAAGNLWCGTDDGIYRAARDSVATGVPQFKPIPIDVGVAGSSGAALVDQDGRVWFSVAHGLIEVAGDQILRYEDEPFKRGASAMTRDGRGRLLAANGGAVFEFVESASPSARGGWRRLPLHLKPDDYIITMTADDAGTLWIGLGRGLLKYRDGQQNLYGAAQGLSDVHIRSLCKDRDGNLWIGTWDGGVCKLAGEMIVSFANAEGLTNKVYQVLESRDGRIITTIDPGVLAQVTESKIVPLLASRKRPFQTGILQGRDGQWWVGTEIVPGGGVFRFRESALQSHRGERLLSSDELGTGYISCMYEDAEGQIWVGATNGNLYRFDPLRRAPPFFERIALPLPLGDRLQPEIPPNRHFVRVMISDGAGAFWIGDLYLLAKYANGKVTVLEPTDGLPECDPRSFFIDHRGWLWIGLRYKGVSMTTDPAADHPRFVNYSTQNGLASDTVWSITEDDSGRMYFGTERGLDRLDVASGRIRHFTTADGLAGHHVNHCMKDSRGCIWVATLTGLSRLDPRAEPVANQTPPVYLSRVQIAGEDLPMAETGTRAVAQIELPTSRNNLLIQYTGIDFHDDHQLRYQYELEGVDTDWSVPTEQRTVNYARLAPGRYRFLVRAVNSDGVVSSVPAVIMFRILPPLWARWWFLTLVAIGLALTLYALYRYRVARLVELERVRTRIATDLHDDIGSSLSRMAILSEVAKRRMEGAEKESASALTEIAESARAVVDSMSDIVWAIDPRRDDLSNVVFRVRQFASDLLGAKGIAWNLQAPSEFDKIKLNPQQRRHIFLIFKEAINNSARHADCHSVSLSLSIVHNRIIAEIGDDGRGFAVTSVHQQLGNGRGGHGLENMQMRAAQLGGSLTIDSSPDQGTLIRVEAPLKRAMA